MSHESEPKDPLDALRDAKGNFTEIAREIAKGVKVDRAKKAPPKDVPLAEKERFKELSDQPARNIDLGIPFRTDPRSPAEAAARKDAATPEELGLLPKPRPLTKPGIGPEARAPQEAEEDGAAHAPQSNTVDTASRAPAEQDRRVLWTLVGAAALLAVVASAMLVRAFVLKPDVTTTHPTGPLMSALESPPPSMTLVPPPPAIVVVATGVPVASGPTAAPQASPKPLPVTTTASAARPVPPPPPPAASAPAPPQPPHTAPPATSSGRLPYILAPE